MAERLEDSVLPPWPDCDVWRSILDPFRSDAAQVERFGRVLLFLIESIQSGADGNARALEALNAGLRLTFPYSAEFELNYQHWLAYLKGNLSPTNEPLNTTRAALESGDGRQRARKHHGRHQEAK